MISYRYCSAASLCVSVLELQNTDQYRNFTSLEELNYDFSAESGVEAALMVPTCSTARAVYALTSRR